MSTVFRYNPDGTAVYQKVGAESYQVADPARVPLSPVKHVDDLTAMQLGLWYILDGIEVVSINRGALVKRGVVEETKFRFHTVALDHPDPEDTQSEQYPLASIMAQDETNLQLADVQSELPLLEETVNVYGQDTVLQKLYESSVTLSLALIFTSKDDRAAARKAIISALAREPLDERKGRRVIIRPYYDRVARYDLMGVTYQDDPDAAQHKLFPMQFRIAADIAVVDLVALPEYMKPSTTLDMDSDTCV